MAGTTRLLVLLAATALLAGGAITYGCAMNRAGGDDDAGDDDGDDSGDDAGDDSGDDAGDDDVVDGFGITWVSIPAGTCPMGCSPADDQCDADEVPRRAVTLSAFRMSTTEITQGQYVAAKGEPPTYHDPCGDDCPVYSATWAESDDLCYAVGGRLPTEAEWEYAARAGTTTRYYCGDDPSCLDAIAWYYANQTGHGRPAAGLKAPNAWGLHDMLGSGWEWTHDWYDGTYYSWGPATDPRGPAAGTGRVMRGGAWDSLAPDLRASNRVAVDPELNYFDFGFRCVKD